LFARVFEIVVDTLKITELKAVFNVSKSTKPEPNTASLSIYNLNEDHRKQIEAKPTVPVSITAGYKDKSSLIFLGNLREVVSSREGADIITSISSGDGEKKKRTGKISKSYPKKTPIKTVIKDLAKAVGLGEGNLEKAIATAKLKSTSDLLLPGGYVVKGNAARELTWLLYSSGLEWSIQNGALQILTKKASLQTTAIKLTPNTGLLGSPSQDSKGILKAECLLIPYLDPGRLVVVESEFVNGQFRIENVNYSGDTFGEWKAAIEAKKY
jgi:hypothetical protein